MSCDALSAKAPSLPLSTCASMRDCSLVLRSVLWRRPEHAARTKSYQKRHSLPLLLLYPFCHFPCYWLEIEVSQQLICVVVPHHLYPWLTFAKCIYLHRNKLPALSCTNTGQITTLMKDAGTAAGLQQARTRSNSPGIMLSLQVPLK